MITLSFLAYAMGPQAAWIAQNKWMLLGASFLLAAGMAMLARIGFHVGKWITNFGSAATLIVLGALVFMPVFPQPSAEAPPRFARCTWSRLRSHLFTLSVFSKMTFGALCGFEYVAIFAGECRNPERNLARSILITAPIIALLYIFGTSAILAFIPANAVDVTAAIPQALSRAFQPFGIARIHSADIGGPAAYQLCFHIQHQFQWLRPPADGRRLGPPATRPGSPALIRNIRRL